MARAGQNTEAYTACLQWPAPSAAQPPVVGSPPLLPSGLPVLVLGAELDSWTPRAICRKCSPGLGGDTRAVVLANSTHVVGEGDTSCGSQLVQEFVADPQAIASLNTSCAAAVPAIHTVGVYPATLAQEPPLTPSSGSSASPTALRLASAAVATAGDAIARYQSIEGSADHGLFGGRVRAKRGGELLILHRDQLIPGVAVSGTVTLRADPNPLSGDDALATLTVRASGAARAHFSARWSTAGEDALAVLSGAVGRETVSGSTPAP